MLLFLEYIHSILDLVREADKIEFSVWCTIGMVIFGITLMIVRSITA